MLRLPPLDGAPGPALPIADEAARALIAGVVSGRRRRRTTSRWAIAATLALLLGSSAAVAAGLYLQRPLGELPPARILLPSPPAPPAPPVMAPAPPPVAVSDALASANRLRGQGRWKAAAAAYERIARAAPASRDAYIALVAAGSLRREKLRDGEGAARLFRRALAVLPRGSLAEEARWGLVNVARQRHEKRAALDSFLRHHPESAHAADARKQRDRLR